MEIAFWIIIGMNIGIGLYYYLQEKGYKIDFTHPDIFRKTPMPTKELKEIERAIGVLTRAETTYIDEEEPMNFKQAYRISIDCMELVKEVVECRYKTYWLDRYKQIRRGK